MRAYVEGRVILIIVRIESAGLYGCKTLPISFGEDKVSGKNFRGSSRILYIYMNTHIHTYVYIYKDKAHIIKRFWTHDCVRQKTKAYSMFLGNMLWARHVVRQVRIGRHRAYWRTCESEGMCKNTACDLTCV